MHQKWKKLLAIVVVLSIVMSSIYLYSIMPIRKVVFSKDDWIKILVDEVKGKSKLSDKLNFTVLVEEFTGDLEGAAECFLALSPLVNISGCINPLIEDDGESSKRFLSLTVRNETRYCGEKGISEIIAIDLWEMSKCILIAKNYSSGLIGSQIASYLNIPLVITNNYPHNIIKKLGVKYCILIDIKMDTPLPTLYLEINETTLFYEYMLKYANESCDIVIITNPYDLNNTWGDEGHFPIAGVSMISSMLSAYYHSPIYFVDGIHENQVGEKNESSTQIGVDVETVNGICAENRDVILHALNDFEELSWSLKYITIVGDPISVPFYYAPYEVNSNLDKFVPSDYYYGEIDDDEDMELAVGRILGPSRADSSLLASRSIIYAEIMKYDYEEDLSKNFYDRYSPYWWKNALDIIGCTTPFPFPMVLTPALRHQWEILKDAGYNVSVLGYDAAVERIVAEILDEMNFVVYYGHGSYDLWYTSNINYLQSSTVYSLYLKPGFASAMACLTGMIDNMTIPCKDFISMAFIHSGFVGYIGATRSAYGLYDFSPQGTSIFEENSALYLVNRFTYYMCIEKMDAGTALLMAKNELIKKQGMGEDGLAWEGAVTVHEYVLYGNPKQMITNAINP